MNTWIVIDTRTMQQVGKAHKSYRTAARYADKLDLAYGAVRYVVKRIVLEA